MVEVYGIRKPRRPSRVGLAVACQASERWIRDTSRLTECLCETTSRRSSGLEEETLVLLWAHADGNLASEVGTIATASVLDELVLDLLVHCRHISGWVKGLCFMRLESVRDVTEEGK